MEEVFLTHLEIEFPEFRHISASLKGEYVNRSFFYVHCFSCMCVHTCLLYWCTMKFNNMPVSQTDKPKKSSGEVRGAFVSIIYKKVCCFLFHYYLCQGVCVFPCIWFVCLFVCLFFLLVYRISQKVLNRFALNVVEGWGIAKGRTNSILGQIWII